MNPMTFPFAPIVPIGRLELDAALQVLQHCSPHRQRQALPYLLSLYSFLTWWESEGAPRFAQPGLSINNAEPDESDELWDEGYEPAAELSLSTTWCERADVLELVDVADLNVEGIQLSFYPVEDDPDQLKIHCPTFLGVVNADLAVAVHLDRSDRRAALLGFSDRRTLIEHWQKYPPDAQGYGQFPIADLQPIYYLSEQISYLQPLPEVPTDTAPEELQVRKTNINAAQVSAIPELATLIEQLSGTQASFPGRETIAATPASSCEDGEAIARLIQAFQGYAQDHDGANLTSLSDLGSV